jgi:hypothetical protein
MEKRGGGRVKGEGRFLEKEKGVSWLKLYWLVS